MADKNQYELMIIIKPTLPENVRMGVESKITQVLESGEGNLKSSDVWGKKHLAYRIKGQTEGYYVIYTFETDPSQLENIEKSLKLNKEILRYLLINKDK